MITIKRHVNFDNWINVNFYGKVVDQFTCRLQAHAFAKKLSKKYKAKVVNLDCGPRHLEKNRESNKI